ncbi:hypothetical protein HWV62_35264 [Athelia sp. TMB]|nr:hypothetical protein HWV62_35264 [Athelia sp. TMB]
MPNGVALAGMFNEIVGNVVDERTIKMAIGVNLGDDVDMKLVNDIVLLTHDGRWRERMFRS